MKRITFSNMRAAMMAALQIGLRFSRNPLEEIMAGRAIFHAMDDAVARNFDPRRWLHEYMATHSDAFITGFERAPKPTRNVGYARRQPTTNTRPHVNYAKRNRRLLKQEPFKLYPYQRAMLRALKRDALTGVVA